LRADDLQLAQALGTMDGAGVKKLRKLEHENARLKRMLADRDLEIDLMKEIAAKKW
jgi:putative transposase